MHRLHLLETLAHYRSAYPDEESTIQRFEHFVNATPQCFERTHEEGHVTGSAFILSPDRSALLLALHAKLNMWIQLGGHADGCPRIDEVAFREAVEESGMTQLQLYPDAVPIDLDVHEIPANKNVKAHLHYDVRFLLFSEEEHFVCSHESLELKWVPLKNFEEFCREPGILRSVGKIRHVLQLAPVSLG